MSDLLEREVVVAELVVEPVLDLSREQKIGYAGLCASCPLVTMFGDCPKTICEQGTAESKDVAISGIEEGAALDAYGVMSDFGDSFKAELDVFEQAIRDLKVGDKTTGDRTSVVEAETGVRLREDNRTEVSVEAEGRSYLDLLFDDTVPVVVAAQFRRETKGEAIATADLAPERKPVEHSAIAAMADFEIPVTDVAQEESVPVAAVLVEREQASTIIDDGPESVQIETDVIAEEPVLVIEEPTLDIDESAVVVELVQEVINDELVVKIEAKNEASVEAETETEIEIEVEVEVEAIEVVNIAHVIENVEPIELIEDDYSSDEPDEIIVESLGTEVDVVVDMGFAPERPEEIEHEQLILVSAVEIILEDEQPDAVGKSIIEERLFQQHASSGTITHSGTRRFLAWFDLSRVGMMLDFNNRYPYGDIVV